MRFDKSKCDACGKCLVHCPYVKMSPARAKKEMNSLLNGKSSVLHDRCYGCMTCAAHCESGCDPYLLIREKWGEREKRKGLPEKARFLMPSAHPNFREGLPMSEKETAVIDGLKKIPEGEDVLYTGCNTLLFPQILESSIFDGLEVFGALDYCCGEMYYRMGLMDAAEAMASNLQKVFSKLRAKRMVFTCAACMNMVSNVYGEKFGITFPFEKIFISDWILARIESGELKIRKPLSGKVTVQDACHSKMMSPKLHDSPRRLLRELGLEVVEMKHHGDDSLCCGIAAACSRYRATDIVAAALMRLSETAACGAKSTVAYCFGCHMSLSMAQAAVPLAPSVLPLLHVTRKALGENDDPTVYKKRSLHMMKSIVTASAPAIINPSRFNVEEVLPEKD